MSPSGLMVAVVDGGGLPAPAVEEGAKSTLAGGGGPVAVGGGAMAMGVAICW